MDNVLKKSYEKVLNDSDFVKLTIFSLLPYSLLFVWYIFYQTYFFINTLKSWFHFYTLKIYIDKVFSYGEAFFVPFVSMIVIWLILYFFFPPIAEWALISYLDKNKSIWSSLGRWLVKFFPMFELHGIMSLFSFLFLFIVISRLYALDMMDSTFIEPLIIIWFIFSLFFNFSVMYAKYFIVLENMGPFDAVRESIKISFLNIKITFKYFIIYILLYFRLIFNILILIWIPLWALYLFLKFWSLDTEIVKYVVFVLMWLMFLLTAYINGIIEAFFISMWYEVFKELDKEE